MAYMKIYIHIPKMQSSYSAAPTFKTQMEKYKSYRSEKNGEPRNLITESKGTLRKKHGAKF